MMEFKKIVDKIYAGLESKLVWCYLRDKIPKMYLNREQLRVQKVMFLPIKKNTSTELRCESHNSKQLFLKLDLGLLYFGWKFMFIESTLVNILCP